MKCNLAPGFMDFMRDFLQGMHVTPPQTCAIQPQNKQSNVTQLQTSIKTAPSCRSFSCNKPNLNLNWICHPLIKLNIPSETKTQPSLNSLIINWPTFTLIASSAHYICTHTPTAWQAWHWKLQSPACWESGQTPSHHHGDGPPLWGEK